MYKKSKVRDWEAEAKQEIMRQWRGGRKYNNPQKAIAVIKHYYHQDRDIDAGMKVLLDVFQSMHFYKNDMQIVDEHTQKFQDLQGKPRVEIEIEFLTDEQFNAWREVNF